MTDILMYGALAGQMACALGGVFCVVLMFRRRAKRRRERESTRLATPEKDQRDWHVAPVSKPR